MGSCMKLSLACQMPTATLFVLSPALCNKNSISSCYVPTSSAESILSQDMCQLHGRIQWRVWLKNRKSIWQCSLPTRSPSCPGSPIHCLNCFVSFQIKLLEHYYVFSACALLMLLWQFSELWMCVRSVHVKLARKFFNFTTGQFRLQSIASLVFWDLVVCILLHLCLPCGIAGMAGTDAAR